MTRDRLPRPQAQACWVAWGSVLPSLGLLLNSRRAAAPTVHRAKGQGWERGPSTGEMTGQSPACTPSGLQHSREGCLSPARGWPGLSFLLVHLLCFPSLMPGDHLHDAPHTGHSLELPRRLTSSRGTRLFQGSHGLQDRHTLLPKPDLEPHNGPSQAQPCPSCPWGLRPGTKAAAPGRWAGRPFPIPAPPPAFVQPLLLPGAIVLPTTEVLRPKEPTGWSVPLWPRAPAVSPDAHPSVCRPHPVACTWASGKDSTKCTPRAASGPGPRASPLPCPCQLTTGCRSDCPPGDHSCPSSSEECPQ